MKILNPYFHLLDVLSSGPLLLDNMLSDWILLSILIRYLVYCLTLIPIYRTYELNCFNLRYYFKGLKGR